MTTVLRIEHPVPDYDAWKAAFDADPVGRARSGVRDFRVLRPVDDERYVMVDLEFDTPAEAEAMLVSLRALWTRIEGTLITDPSARIVETVATSAG
ncbi:hypothetical protein BH18ACT17_BH18ACT17_14660 [soil metagenome]